MSRFEYPRLPRREIIVVLADCGIATVTEADLANPNPDFVFNLYTQLLVHLDILKGEDIGLIEFSKLEHLENPDLHVDSVRYMTLFHNIGSILNFLECPKRFSIKDLIKPDAERTECFVSAILNFCLHRDTRMNELRQFADELSVLDEQRKAFEDRMSQLTLELSELNESRDREMPLIQELDAKIKEMRQSISAYNKHQMSLKESINKKKEISKEMEEEISSAEFALSQSVQENARLRSKIVQSPVKLQRALEEKKAVLVEAKNAERAAMQSYHEQSAVLEVYTKASEKMNKHLEQMQTLQEEVNSAKQVEKDVKFLRVKIRDQELLDKPLDVKLFELQGRADQLEELVKLTEKERDASCEEASKELNNVKSQLEFDRRGLEQRRRNVEALVVEAAAINENVNKVKEEATARKQMLLSKAQELAEEFFKHSNATGPVISQIEALDVEDP
uniref:kinetochore protein NUF2 homolog n=1 Tax=Erigeron canadensis TaxID=72917 RepID=UPI001CB8BDE0|nr:kinetochore protein NUF2 homolog [Erigeron canadensis]